MSNIIFKATAIWFVIVIAAILNGLFREKVLVPTIGTDLALPLSGIILSALVLLVSLLLVPYFDSADAKTYILIGIFWVALTLAFELLFGHYVAGKSWQTIIQVFNIRKGNLFIVVIFITAIAPWLAAKLRSIV